MRICSLVHKNVGADQCSNMLMKLEEDAEVAYNQYDKAVKAEDRAESYVNRVSRLILVKIKSFILVKISFSFMNQF